MQTRKERFQELMFSIYWNDQKEYEEYWVSNVWGFGDRMRDYLLEGHRRMKMNW